MHDDGHSIVVRGPKHPSNLLDVSRIVKVDDGVSEVQLEASTEIRIPDAPRQFVERVILEWVQTAEANETVRELCDFTAGPIVLTPDFLRE